MKKVWVLEKFVSVDEMQKSLSKLFEMREMNEGKEEAIRACDEMIAAYKKRMDANPDGYWLGYQGKTIYRQFCQCAHDTMRNLKGSTFRVVEGEIADDAKMWLGYKVVKVNDGVMRYLYATM